jgi:hypothetical protein
MEVRGLTSAPHSSATPTKRSSLVFMVAGFLTLSLFYYAWMTGFTFGPTELPVFPNYNMLAKSFLAGRLDILDNPPEDYSLFGGKKYLYFGPVPALFHAFFRIIGWEISTGFMIALFAAGTWAVFLLILLQLGSDDTRKPLGRLQIAFAALFAFNGYTLWMVSVPSIHHEAIGSAIFFLLLAIYFTLKAAQNSYMFSASGGLIIGLSLVLSLGSRFSYFLTVTFLAVSLGTGMLRNREGKAWSKSLLPFAAILGTVVSGFVLLLVYNYARFNSFTEFGMRYATSLYSQYLLQGNFFRYDHIPYNLWSYLFYIPPGDPHFPYVKLPFYVLKAESVRGLPYFLVHVNELCASIFCFLPVLLFCFVPLFKGATNLTASKQSALRLFAVVFAFQIIPLSMSMAAITRYYYDFLPVMMVIAFLGIEQVQEQLQHKKLTLIVISAISILFSFAVTINALRFHEVFSEYRSPLLNLFCC